MKYLSPLVIVFMFCISSTLAFAHDQVVVVPFVSSKKLQNVVTVSHRGGDFADPIAAVNSITDAADDNPYLVLIGPGVYTISETLVMKPYVSIVGSGEVITKLNSYGTFEKWYFIEGADNAFLKNLTIEVGDISDGGPGGTSTGIYNENSSPVIENVTILVNGLMIGTGVSNNHSSPVMTNITIEVYGAISHYGVRNKLSSSPTISRSVINNSDVGIYVDGGTTRVTQSSIIGGVSITGGGTLSCLYSDNGVDKELDSSCAVIP